MGRINVQVSVESFRDLHHQDVFDKNFLEVKNTRLNKKFDLIIIKKLMLVYARQLKYGTINIKKQEIFNKNNNTKFE